MNDYNKLQVCIRLTPYEYKLFRKFKDEHNLTIREILEYSGRPCEKCKGINAIAFDKITDEPILIPRGILTRKK